MTTMSYKQPVINPNQMNEIKRKAQGGIALAQFTPEKEALYNMYKQQTAPKPELGNMNSSITDMQNQMNTQVNSIYDKQKQAQLAQLQASRDKAVGNINYQKSLVAPQYQGMRNQTDTTNQQNVKKLQEIMAANGLNATGENVSATAAMNNERVNSLNKLNLQEQQTMNDFERQITDLMNPADENALIAAIEAQRSQALYDGSNRAQDVGYSRYRDQVGDYRYDSDRAYNQGRDTIADNRYNNEWNYGINRDAENDKRYYDERDYGRGRDALSDRRYDDETKYSRGRDALSDRRYDDETKYNRGQDSLNWDWMRDGRSYDRGRDAIGDARYKDETAYNRGRDAKADAKASGSYGYSSNGIPLSPEDVLRELLSGMDADTYKKMREGSLKLDPKATTGVAAQPGSYWWGRGYGNQYLPK
jgi:hypothetical protein